MKLLCRSSDIDTKGGCNINSWSDHPEYRFYHLPQRDFSLSTHSQRCSSRVPVSTALRALQTVSFDLLVGTSSSSQFRSSLSAHLTLVLDSHLRLLRRVPGQPHPSLNKITLPIRLFLTISSLFPHTHHQTSPVHMISPSWTRQPNVPRTF